MNNIDYDITFLYERTPAKDKNGDYLWDIEEHCLIPNTTGIVQRGTIRSISCNRITTNKSGICNACATIPSLTAFRLRVFRHKNKPEPKLKTNNKHLGSTQAIMKFSAIRSKSKREAMKQVWVHTKTQKLLAQKQRLVSKIKSAADCGDVSEICKNLQSAYEAGLLSNKTNILSFMKTLSANLGKKAKGRRYDEFTRQMALSFNILGGPLLAKTFSENLLGPSDGTLRKIKKMERQPISVGLVDEPFIYAANVIKQSMINNQITTPVLVELAQDETVIIKKLQWIPKLDIIVGSCGESGPHHKCDASYHLEVGNTAESYDRVRDFFEKSVIAHNAHVSMLHPLHPSLPAVVIFMMATCNTFTHKDALALWDELEQKYRKIVFPITKCPLSSKASDGDSRRAKAMEIRAYGDGPEKYGITNTPSFTAFGHLKRNETGDVYSLDIQNQDYIHCGKKLSYPLDHAKRTLMLGPHMAHISHLELVAERFDIATHGLRNEDIHRTDRQNWASAQRMFFPRVRDCLLQIEHGDRPEGVKGTRIYLEICWKFVEIFCSFQATLLERVIYASEVTNFLRLWRWWVYKNPNLTLANNFLTRQCFQHVILCCHAAVLLIMASRDFAPDHPIHLALCGSDCCEDHFSLHGSWIDNKHTYSYGDMLQNKANMDTVLKLRSNPSGPIIPKRHKKQENIWDKGNPKPDQPPDMKDWPTDEALKVAWEKGLSLAQEKFRDLCKLPLKKKNYYLHRTVF